MSFYDVGAEFPMGWLITSDGSTIVSHAGEPLVTTMSREKVDSMWGDGINVLGGATLEIVPAIRRVDVRVHNKMQGSLVDQMGIYDLERWSATDGLLSLSQPDSLRLKGNNDYSGTVFWHDGCHVDKSASRLIFKMNITTAYHYRIISGSGTRPTDTEKTIIVEYGFRLTGTDATYYLDEDGSWQTERITISEGVKTSEGSERTIEMAGFPASGQLQFFIVQCLSGYSAARNSQWQSANFSQMSITLDAEEDFESDPSYGLAVIAANNIDQENFFGGTAEEMHVDNQLVAKSLAPNASFKHAFGANFSNTAMQHSVNQVVLKMACPRKIISPRTVRICLPSAKMVRIRYCPSRILNVLARIDAVA